MNTHVKFIKKVLKHDMDYPRSRYPVIFNELVRWHDDEVRYGRKSKGKVNFIFDLKHNRHRKNVRDNISELNKCLQLIYSRNVGELDKFIKAFLEFYHITKDSPSVRSNMNIINKNFMIDSLIDEYGTVYTSIFNIFSYELKHYVNFEDKNVICNLTFTKQFKEFVFKYIEYYIKWAPVADLNQKLEGDYE